MRRSETYISLLKDLDNTYDSTPGRHLVSALTHSVQTAQRALAANADREMVVCALLHDAFRLIAPETHGEAIAIALSDCISLERMLILVTHSEWQHDAIHGTNRHERYRSCNWYEDACRFGEWDASSFDVDEPAPNVENFRLMLEEVLD